MTQTTERQQYRVDYGVAGETTWAHNALTFDTPAEAEAEAWARYARWTMMMSARVVTIDTPRSEPIDLDDPRVVIR